MTEDVVILEPGDDRAQKIGKALANRTANDIISMLKSSDMTLSEISEKLNQPMTSTKYHVENLLDAGLIEVKKIKYSEKGREVKVYAASGQVVIVSPGVKDIRQILLKYASVFGIFLFAALIMGITASTVFTGMPMLKDAATSENSGEVFMNTVYCSTDSGPYQVMTAPATPVMNNNTGDDAGKQVDVGHPQYTTSTGERTNGSERIVQPMNTDMKYQITVTAGMHPAEPVKDNSMTYIIMGFLIGGATVIVCLALFEICSAGRVNRPKRGKKDREE
ncbi:MAG: helix-turn-helix transcriptional regulator [Methanomicrobium sp.]|nr:helix-turn-helix transcriptional regulator [Methanomicrobium sp.]